MVLLTAASGDVTIELVGDAAPLAATLKVGDLVNATGDVRSDGHVIVAERADLVRIAANGANSATQAAQTATPVAFGPTTHQFTPTQSSPIAPLVALLAILGLVGALVVGALAIKLSGRNRVRNLVNRLKARFVRI